MTGPGLDRRSFALAAGSLAGGLTLAGGARPSPDTAEMGLTHDNGAIHQEVAFKASAAQIYRVLTDPALFDKVVVLSGAMQTAQLAAAPAQISPDVGGPFSLFGGYITGRHIELTPGVRLIQAWRAGSWKANIYSIVKFELMAHPGGAMLVFDHTGFPNDEGQSLADGWRKHYWAPMAKVMA